MGRPGSLWASVTQALATRGIADHTHASTRLLASVATPHQAARLRLPGSAALLRSTSIDVEARGRPVEYGATWFAGDRAR